jgi:N-dimethylarginine dimethylaminohydrolase
VVVIARQRKGRTITKVTKTEAEGVAFVKAVVSANAEVHADEASHWDALHAKFTTMRINHSEAYSKDGACTNQAESFLARLRRLWRRIETASGKAMLQCLVATLWQIR